MYAEKEDLLQSVYNHGEELTESLPFLSMTVLSNQSSSSAWIEVQLIDVTFSSLILVIEKSIYHSSRLFRISLDCEVIDMCNDD